MSGIRPTDHVPSPPMPAVAVTSNARRETTVLPVPLTSFVGREREVEQLIALLRRSDVRLLTLTGPGGVGKTRLALRVAAELGPGFADGVAFVDLAPIADPDLVGPTVAHALGVREAGDLPVAERLRDALRDHALLLVLDNFEHVIKAAGLVADLLTTFPMLTVLVTSREPLRLSAERLVTVPPLTLPDPARPPEQLVEAEAVRLFVERAEAVRSSFALSDANTTAVAEICRRLDGLPLAIELAAARINILPPRGLLAGLDHRLDVLTHGPRDAPVRLQTMRDAISWSYDLLTPAEQTLFRRLAVFVDGCTLEAMAAIGPDGTDVLEGIAALIATSLLQYQEEPHGEPRYRMLETVREYALERLAVSREEPAVRRAQAHFFLDWVERLWDTPSWPEAERWLRQLRPDLDNLRAALTWLVTHEPAEAVRLAGALDIFWYHNGLFAEGHQWLMNCLVAAPDVSPFVRTRALLAAGWLAHELGDFEQAEIDLTEALAQARVLADARLLADALATLGTVNLSQGQPERARPLIGEQRTLASATGDPLQIAIATLNAGCVAFQMGELQQAEMFLEEALDLHQRYNGPYAAAHAQGWLGQVALARGDTARAALLFRDAIAGFAAADQWAVVAEYFEALARATVVSQPVPTVQLLGAAAAMRERFGHPRKPSEGPAYDRVLATARATLGGAAFTVTWDAGRQMSPEEVLAEATAVATTTSSTRAPMPPEAASCHGLTNRELEVLKLVAAGRSNREIADALFISVPTVKRHFSTILGKLGLPSRSAVTAYAHTYHLV